MFYKSHRYVLFLILLFCLPGKYIHAQTGDYFVQNFLPKDYQGSANNFGAVQNDEGLIFIANNTGVLIFDGINWSQCSRSDLVEVVSIGKTAGGTIVAGTGDGDIAEITKDKNGRYRYHSIRMMLPVEERPADYIRQIFTVGHVTYFLSSDKLIEYSSPQIRSYAPRTSFHNRAMVMGKHVFVAETGKSISVLQNGKLMPLPGTSELANDKFFFCFPLNVSRYAVGFRTTGIQVACYDSLHPQNTFFRKRESPCDKELLSAAINNGCLLRNGNCIVTTNKKGAFEIDTTLNIVAKFDTRNGIYEDNIKSCFQDKNGNLWLALYYGVAYVEINSVVARYNRSNGIAGVVQSAAYFGKKLYIATDKGVQYYDSIEHEFLPLQDFDRQTWTMLPAENRLFFGTLQGLFCYESGQMKQLDEENTFSILCDPVRRGLLYAGTQNGVRIYRVGKRDISLLKTIQLNGPVKNMTADRWGSVYFNTTNRSIYFLDAKKEFKLDSIDNMDSLPDDYFENFIFSFDGEPMLGAFDGIYSIREDKNGRKLCVKDKRFYPPTKDSEIFRASQMGNNIICSQRYWDSHKNKTEYPITLLELQDDGSFKSIAINHLKDVFPNSITFDTLHKILLVSANEGLFLVKQKDRDKHQSYNFFLHQLVSGSDTLLEHLSSTDASASIPLVISYDKNNLLVILGFNSTELSDPEFSYMLANSDSDYHPWTVENKIILNNLHEGDYVLKLRARTQEGAKEYKIDVRIKIQPPWYRSSYMYLAYLFLFAAFVYLVVILNSRRLQRINRKLEATIAERTRTISIQKQELEHKQKEILDSINYAQRIQHSLLASDRFLHTHLPSHFILFKPKDVVSGDFYWAAQLNNGRFMLVTADSTGHGVPGAIMSMLNISCLKEAVEAEKLSEPSQILNHTRRKVIETLANDGSAEGGKDGMDCSLISFDFHDYKFSYAAANNPVWIVRKKEDASGSNEVTLIELAADKMPVGKHDKDNISFNQHEVQLQGGDMIYALTDGMPDQFGGSKGKKFMYNRLKNLLLSISHLPVKQQKAMLEKELAEWRGELEQVDDITLIGIRV